MREVWGTRAHTEGLFPVYVREARAAQGRHAGCRRVSPSPHGPLESRPSNRREQGNPNN